MLVAMCQSCMTITESMFVKCTCACSKGDVVVDNGQFYCKNCRHRLMTA